MGKIKKRIKKFFDLLRQYRTAISVDAEGKVLNKVSIAFKYMRANIKYGINPLSYSLYQLDNVPEAEWDRYVVNQREFDQLLVSKSTVESRRIAGNKLQFYHHCLKNGLPVIPILCVVANDLNLPLGSIELVSNLKQWRAKMATAPVEMFIKPVVGSKGDDAFPVKRDGDNFKFADCNGTVDDLFHYLQVRLNKPGRGFLVQPKMRPNPSLVGVVSAGGLSTVRVITLMGNGEPKILMACLKIIGGNNVHDNFLHGMSNNLVASISIETGILATAWGSSKRNWPKMAKISHNPDTGIKIEGFGLPCWQELVQLSLKGQESLSSIQTIGWDIALTSEGVFIVEANTAYGVALFQVAHQRGLKGVFHSALCPTKHSTESKV